MIGESGEGRPLLVLVVGEGRTKPGVFLEGGIHARWHLCSGHHGALE